MRDAWAVIRREYLQRVRSKWFALSTIGVPVLLVVASVAPAWMASREGGGERLIVLVDRTGVLAERVARHLEEGGLTVEIAGRSADEREVRARVLRGEVGGYLVLDRGALSSGRALLEVNQAPPALRSLAIRSAVVQGALEARLGGDDAEVASLLEGGNLRVQVLSGHGGGIASPAIVTAMVGAFVLYMVILLYAVAVMRSVLEEKSSRVVEVILSSMRPWHLMLGKVLGVGAVGLTQLAIWAVAAAALFTLALPYAIAARPELARMGDLGRYAPGVAYLGLFLVFFVCGYFMYSGLYAAVGAMCNTDEEAQQAQTPLVVLLVMPIMLLMPVLDRPGATASVLLSLFPIFSPVLMFARAAGGAAPAWQVWLSVVLMVLTVVGVAWVAGRIYRVGILMAGKRPTLAELWRWVREG